MTQPNKANYRSEKVEETWLCLEAPLSISYQTPMNSFPCFLPILLYPAVSCVASVVQNLRPVLKYIFVPSLQSLHRLTEDQGLVAALQNKSILSCPLKAVKYLYLPSARGICSISVRRVNFQLAICN